MHVLKAVSLKNLSEKGISMDFLYNDDKNNIFIPKRKWELFSEKIFREKYNNWENLIYNDFDTDDHFATEESKLSKN